MNKLCVLFLCTLATTLVYGKVLSPRDILDEARQQLENLKNTIKGDIAVAHDDLDQMQLDFFTYSNNVITTGSVALQQEHETILGQITTLKELGASAGKDVTPCTEDGETVINRLTGICAMGTFRCVRANLDQVERLVNSSKYIVDVNINTVHHLEEQLNRCGTSLICLQPIITEIQLDTVRLPANIKSEVTATQSFLTNIEVDVQGCSDIEVSAYTSSANSIVADITKCVNGMLS